MGGEAMASAKEPLERLTIREIVERYCAMRAGGIAFESCGTKKAG
jgi:hypothetical protein